MNFNNLFEFELMKLIEARIATLSENITNAHAVVDYSDYKYQVGINKLVHKPGQSITEFLDLM